MRWLRVASVAEVDGDETAGTLRPTDVGVVEVRLTEDLAPAGRGRVRVGYGQLDRGDGADDVGAHGSLPVRPGRRPRTVRIVAAGLEVDLEERSSGVAGVQLPDLVAVVVGLEGGPDVEFHSTFAERGLVVGVADHHVAAVTSQALELTAGGGALGDR